MSQKSNPQVQDAEAGFAELGIEPELIEALGRLRNAPPTPLQCQMIPALLAGEDCLIEAPSGAGKTNGYILPLVQRTRSAGGIQTIILQPTRTLVGQLERNLARIADARGLRICAPEESRGRPAHRAAASPQQAEFLVATPATALRMIEDEEFDAATVRCVVIDEADVVCNDGRCDTLNDIFERLGSDVQTIMIAAELDDEVRALAEQRLKSARRIAAPAGMSRAEQAEQCWFETDPAARFDALVAFIRQGPPKFAVVFANNEGSADELLDHLQRIRMNARSIGERPPRGPRRPGSEIVVACDPAPPRLSTMSATHLIHYELPDNPQTYTRRLERCARLRRGGFSVALVIAEHQDRLEAIHAAIGRTLTRIETPQPQPRNRDGRGPRDSRSGDGRGEGTRGGDGRRGGARERGGPPPQRSAPAGQDPVARRDTPPPPAAFPASTGERIVPERFLTVIRRDAELEAQGIMPMPRTLGSRFPTERNYRLMRSALNRVKASADEDAV